MKKSILIVEDDGPLAAIYQRYLNKEFPGVPSDLRENWNDLERITTDQRHGVIITDRQMPGMDGLTAIRELRARGIATPILLVCSSPSGEADPDGDRRMALEAGATAYIPKCDDFHELCTAICEKVRELYQH